MQHIFSLTLQHDQDVVRARQRAAHLSQLLGFDPSEQTRIATAVSEIVRNAFRYARQGSVSFAIDEETRPQRLIIRVADRGPGIASLDDVLSGRYRSSTGMGLGIVGARRLMDGFQIESSAAGTTVTLEKWLSSRQVLLTPDGVRQLGEALRRRRPDDLVEEVQHQNQELLRALDELQRKQQELVHLNRELEDTNRGVVALYAELDEKADHLRRADELKSRFLSNMTHEFRTPVNSILGLSKLLLDDYQREAQPAVPEVVYIRQAAEQLSDLVNDLLDLAKVEAGKSVVRPNEFEVQNIFGALRGMLRPLLLNQSVSLVFEDVEDIAPLYTDEGKLSQILRNLISNALKYTERGEVRVSAAADGAGAIVFAVADTGIGIAEEDQPLIFEEFTQLEHSLQRRVRGTGLGLPLSRRLAELLGGTLSVQSELGIGSTFSLKIPTQYSARPAPAPAIEWVPAPGRIPVLVVEDAADVQYFYEKVLRSSIYQIYPARSIAEAEAALERMAPAAVVLDLILEHEDAWEFFARLKRDPSTRAVPVIAVSSAPERERALRLGAYAFLAKPLDRWTVVKTVDAAVARPEPPVRVLVVDDQETARYLVRQCLPRPEFEVSETASAEEGLALAGQERPDVILLDLVMPGMTGREALRRLRADQATRDIPVIIVTSQRVESDERDDLLDHATAILPKSDVTRDTLCQAVRAAARSGSGEHSQTAAPPHPL